MEKFNETQLLATENQLLREAIIGLAGEAEFLFCFSCFNYGKRGSYYATICARCGEWTCEDCTGVSTKNPTDTTNICGIDYCWQCYEQIKDKDKTVQMTISEENVEGEMIPLDWDRFQSNFKEDVIDHITDVINDFYESGEYFQYEVHHLNLFKNPENHCQIGFYFEVKEEYQDEIKNGIKDGIVEDVSLDELKDDLASYLYDGIGGFHFEPDSVVRNPGGTDKTITLHLEF